MAQNNTATDARTDEQKTTMADAWTEYEVDYRDAEKMEVVYEDDQTVIVADHVGYEINEWANEFGVDRETLRSSFRAVADEKMGEKEAHAIFSSADPVVFGKE